MPQCHNPRHINSSYNYPLRHTSFLTFPRFPSRYLLPPPPPNRPHPFRNLPLNPPLPPHHANPHLHLPVLLRPHPPDLLRPHSRALKPQLPHPPLRHFITPQLLPHPHNRLRNRRHRRRRGVIQLEEDFFGLRRSEERRVGKGWR